MKPLPEWFDGYVYPKGDTVQNMFSGETAKLNANELSMYDFIKGAEMILQSTNFASQELLTKMREGILWFMDANPSAYLRLLD